TGSFAPELINDASFAQNSLKINKRLLIVEYDLIHQILDKRAVQNKCTVIVDSNSVSVRFLLRICFDLIRNRLGFGNTIKNLYYLSHHPLKALYRCRRYR